MPVYEYRCQSCQKQFEYEHRMSEKRTECVECGGALERMVSRSSFVFKGGGWYKDLYASPKPSSMSGESTGAGASSAASTDSSSSSSSSDKGSSSSDKGSSSSASDKGSSSDQGASPPAKGGGGGAASGGGPAASS